MQTVRIVLLLSVSVALLPGASISLSISAPGEQATFVGSALTETFNSPALGIRTTSFNAAIGVYQLNTNSALAILAANQYGGANGSNYVSLGAQSATYTPVSLQLNASYNYFGFWWSAGDRNNGLSLYDGDQFLARISTADITNRLSPTTGQVQAVNGSFYNNSLFYGNPNDLTQNTGEPYAYVSLIATGVTFNRIVFDNSGTTGTGFESDNHSVYFGSISVPGTSVLISYTPTAVPEPATFALCGAALLALGYTRRRRA
jgi:hypothetical protein